MLQQNASITKERFPTTQFNKFSAVKQANLQHTCFQTRAKCLYHAVILNKILTSQKKVWMNGCIHLNKNRENKTAILHNKK